MQKYFLTISLMALCLLGNGCEMAQSKAENNTSPSKSLITDGNDIRVVSIVPKTTETRDIGYHFTLLPDKTVWAIGGWNSYSELYFTSDMGVTWQNVDVPVDTLSASSDIYFSDSRNGWAAGWLRIVHTTDGGASWRSIPLPKESKITDLQAVNFFDSQIGYIGGTTSYLNRDESKPRIGIEILCSTDGGKSLQVCYKSSKYGTIFQLAAISDSVAMALLDGVALLVTNDKGHTWKEIEFNGNGWYIGSSGNGRIWLVGGHGMFQSSQDNGQTWNQTTSFTKGFSDSKWNSIAFNGIRQGIAVGENGLVAYTDNDSQGWRIQPKFTSEHLRHVVLQDSLAVISGENNLYFVELH